MDQREAALQVVKDLQAAGFEAYWVGGCVRDLLLGRTPKDYDVSTNAIPPQIESLFPKTIPVGRQFGVVVVVVRDCQIQVATYRAESDYQDGRRPGNVSFGDPQADALRRDFTINGLFLDLVRNELRDWVGGREDLQARIIRAIGHPHERFAEDHLRLLRAVRFAAQLDFTIEPATLAAIRDHAHTINRVSAERLRDELVRLFLPPHAARGLDLLRATTLLPQVLPEVATMIGSEQSPQFHPEGDVYTHTRLMLEQLPVDAPHELAWMVLLHDVGKPATAAVDPKDNQIHSYGHERVGAELAEALLRRLKFSNKEIEVIVTGVRCHMQFKDAPQMRKSSRRRLLMRPTFGLELELHRLDCLGSHRQLDIYEFLQTEAQILADQPAIVPPLVSGHDLLALGVKPGPELGRLLAEIRERQLQDDLTTKEEALAWVRQQLPGAHSHL